MKVKCNYKPYAGRVSHMNKPPAATTLPQELDWENMLGLGKHAMSQGN